MGSRRFIDRVTSALGHRAADCNVRPFGAAFLVRHAEARYGHVFQAKNIAPSLKNEPFEEQRLYQTAP